MRSRAVAVSPALLIQEDLSGGSSGRLIDALQQEVEKFFPAGGYEPGITGQDAHHQASAKITPQGLGYLRWSEALHEIQDVIPLFVAVVGNAPVNHVGDVHIATETSTPGFVETSEEGGGGVANFDGLSGNFSCHLTGVDSEANAFADQG